MGVSLKMFKLMVSYDCGGSYREERTVDDSALLDKRCEELDERRLRWIVEDEEGNIVRVCQIHARTIAMMEHLNAESKRGLLLNPR